MMEWLTDVADLPPAEEPGQWNENAIYVLWWDDWLHRPMVAMRTRMSGSKRSKAAWMALNATGDRFFPCEGHGAPDRWARVPGPGKGRV